jgi:transcriptional regulator with XRE-family HTH domain
MHRPKYKQNTLALYRRRMGYTQKQVAKFLGNPDATMISHYESNRALPPLGVALSLEILYRTPVAFLFPGLHDDLKRVLREREECSAASPGQQSLPLTQPPR